MGKKERLFIDDADADDGGDVSLSVNAEFAARLEHNKRREELHRLQEKLAAEGVRVQEAADGGDEESSSSDDSEDDVDLEEELRDPAFLKALAKARGRSVSPGATGSSGSDGEGEEAEAEEAPQTKKRKREKPLLLKDLRATEAVEGSDADDAPACKPYARDLEDSRRSFLQAAEAAAEPADGDLFVPRGGADAGAGEAPARRAQQADVAQLLDRYFGKDEELSNDDLFLKRFISRPDPGDSGDEGGAWRPEDDLEEDEAHLQEADRFEAQHNFRFEEPDAGTVRTYPRAVEGVVRQGDGKRAEARARKKARRAEERARRDAEVARLKNLKRQEIEDRLREIQRQSGAGVAEARLAQLLASADFDAAEYDAAMARAFDDAYYEAEGDAPPESDGGEGGSGSEGEGAGAAPEAGFRAARRQLTAGGKAGVERSAAEVQRLLEECHRLDYEDVVAGQPTRFKYRQVEAADYGLSTADILGLSDKELNQVVGLKKLAPYRREAGNQKKGYFQARHRLQAVRAEQQEKAARRKAGKKQEGVRTDAPAEAVPPQQSAAERRLATFAKPQLKGRIEKSHGKGKGKVRPKQQEPGSATDGLTKAQRRNMRRSRKRAEA